MPTTDKLTAAIADEAIAELDALLPLLADPDRREEFNKRLASLEALHAIVAGDDQRGDPRT